MKMHTLKNVLLFPMLFTIAACISGPPLWPPVYSVDFMEDGYMTKGKPLYKNTGSWYYDFDHNMARFDKGEGQHDFECGQQAKHLSPKDLQAPCQLLFANDTNMYVIYPMTKTCCTPCGDKEYCGVIKPNWLQNATYVGTQTFENTMCYGWAINGATSKDFWYVTDKNVPCQYHQIPYKSSQPVVEMIFKQESYKLSVPDASMFMIPEYCKGKCPMA